MKRKIQRRPPSFRPTRPLKAMEEFFLSFKRKASQSSLSFKIVIFIGGLALGFICNEKISHDSPQALPLGEVQVCFTPGQLCLPLIQQVLEQAKNVIHLQAYSFTQARIAQDLIKAARRGVKVTVILDKSQRTARSSQLSLLKGTPIKVFFDDKPAIAHNKIIILDGKILVTGSYNFTQAAETKNAENLLIVHSSKLAEIYEQNFQKRLKVSRLAFQGPNS